MSEPFWDRGRYEREKRNFIETRQRFHFVFAGCVRVWSDLMRADRGGGTWDGTGADVLALDEGCLIVVAVMALGLIAGAAFAMLGGIPL